MFDSEALRDELKSLKVDLSRVLNANGEEMLNQSKARAEALADQIKVARNELGEPSARKKATLRKWWRSVRLPRSPRLSRLASSSVSWQAGILA
jgi:hypothetical protein